MKVKKAFTWHRSFSALPDAVEVPAGATAHFSKKCDCFFVDPGNFPEGSIEKHDAIHYGCRVDPDNLEG